MASSFKAEDAEKALGANLVELLVAELLFAGCNTVVNTIFTAIYLLHENPRCLVKLRGEYDKELGARPITAQGMDKLKYSDMVFKETLRLHPPASAIARKIQKDVKLGNMEIPEGVEAMFCMMGLHTDPAYWGDGYD